MTLGIGLDDVDIDFWQILRQIALPIFWFLVWIGFSGMDWICIFPKQENIANLETWLSMINRQDCHDLQTSPSLQSWFLSRFNFHCSCNLFFPATYKNRLMDPDPVFMLILQFIDSSVVLINSKRREEILGSSSSTSHLENIILWILRPYFEISILSSNKEKSKIGMMTAVSLFL